MMKRKSLPVLLVVLMLGLVLSVTMLMISAQAGDTHPADNQAEETVGETDGAETTGTDAETEAGGEEETTTEDGEDEGEDEEEKKGLGLGFWISMGVLGVLIIIAVVLGIRKRESLARWLRSYKSELHKIVWMPWKDVRKSTLVVIVVVVSIGVLIGLLDYLFSRGIIELGNLVRL
ncbi:MAG: preprotein translocase subunit SecE [Clostridiales bacterium]|jgi:preprotein translocase SecE subunit|nr:preprotein translocase subunit SecE [Clostridiales bacterium]HOA85005.1 preprotein translocase subunit SecE [Bacillota bacterium]